MRARRSKQIKVNGTQSGSPALRRNRLCYFHQRHHEEQIALNIDRSNHDRVNNEKAKNEKDKSGKTRTNETKNTRSGKATLNLPVLEDANSIQVTLMQIMRLLIAGQIDAKIAGLLLYALQTASINLRQTRFEPNRHQVVLDPAAAAETPLGAFELWSDEDWSDDGFEEDDFQEEDEDSDEKQDNTEAEHEPSSRAVPALLLRRGECRA